MSSSSSLARDFFGVVDLGEEVDGRIGNLGHAFLTRVDLARVGLVSRQQFEQRAFAAARESDQTGLHG